MHWQTTVVEAMTKPGTAAATKLGTALTKLDSAVVVASAMEPDSRAATVVGSSVAAAAAAVDAAVLATRNHQQVVGRE